MSDTKTALVRFKDGLSIPAEYSGQADKISLSDVSDNDRAELRRLGAEVVQASKDYASKYIALCRFIHHKAFNPADLKKQLDSIGMIKERISEIKTVCFTSPEIFNDYMNRITGFRAALSKARMQVRGIEASQRQWLLLCNQFERLFHKAEPSIPHYQGNGCCMVMWRQKEFPDANKKEFSFDGWKVVVTRNETKTPKTKVKK